MASSATGSSTVQSSKTEVHTPKTQAMKSRSSQFIQNIPDDIARLIAFYALPSKPSPNRSQSPVSLSQVSSAWRNVILSSSELWSTLLITAEGLDALEICQQQATVWLGRAECRPLTIFFHFDADDREDDLSELQNFLSSLSPFVPRARRIGLWYTYIHKLLALLPSVSWTLDNLEAFDLVCDFGDGPADDFIDESEDLPIVRVLEHAPNLRQLGIEGEFMGTALESELVLPWSRLTKVTVTYDLSVASWVTIMRSCPQMEFGDFDIGEGYQDGLERFRSPNQVHTRLESLNLKIPDRVVEVTSIFHFTNLRNLYLKSNLQNAEDGIPAASKFRNFHGLHSLYIDTSSHLHLPSLKQILREGSNIEELTLIYIRKGQESLFKAMSYSASPPMLPHLSFLRIDLYPEARVKQLEPHWNMLHEMLMSRSVGIMPEGCHQLRKISMSTSPIATSLYTGAFFGPYYPVVGHLTQMLFPCHEAGVEIISNEDSEMDWKPVRIGVFEL